MNLLEYYESIGQTTIDQFIKEHRVEDLHLDFKRIVSSDLSNKSDKEKLSIALSGFANSDGGILIWGVDARKNSEGIDCAQNIESIDNVHLCLSRLNEFTGQFVTPTVNGVLHDLIGNTGCIKTYVPMSDSGPHMAIGGNWKWYYKRNGGSFLAMEHYEIADMFGRRKKPKLELYTKVKTGSVCGGNKFECKIIIGIKNSGRALAKYPYLSLEVGGAYRIHAQGFGNYQHGLPRILHSETSKYIFAGDSNSVIHVNTELEISLINFYLAIHNSQHYIVDPASSREAYSQILTDVKIDYEIGAEGLNIQSGTHMLKKQDIIIGMHPYLQ